MNENETKQVKLFIIFVIRSEFLCEANLKIRTPNLLSQFDAN